MKNKIFSLISRLSFTTFLCAIAIIMSMFAWHWEVEMEELKKQFGEVRHEVSNLRLDTAGFKTMLLTEINRTHYIPLLSDEIDKAVAPQP